MRKGNVSVLGMSLVVVLVLAAIFLYTNFIKPKPAEAPITPSNNTSPIENLNSATTDSLLNTITSSPSHQDVTLSDVTGGNSTGAAYILRDDMLYHVVGASLSDPGKNSYEGWLVNSSGDFFSTGVMQQTSSGWLLEFTNNNLYDGYNKVVITEETVVDATPETHILEGSFN